MIPLGIMLAAGEAKRLPNKALLPVGRLTVAIESGLGLLRRNCSTIVVVTNGNGIIRGVLSHRDSVNYTWAVQPEPIGVAHAICVGLLEAEKAHGVQFPKALVAFCDNVYDIVERPRGLWEVPCSVASVRPVEDHIGKELDRWDPVMKHWVDRTNASNDMPALAGWYGLTRDDILRGATELGSTTFLNKINAQPIKVDHKWCDIGTVESYLNFIEKEL